jgi:hypothetical protein
MSVKRYILIVALLLIAQQSFSQLIRADYKKAELIYHRPVVVPIYDLTDAADACESAQMSWFNEAMRELMPEYWALNDSVIFMEKRMLTSIIGSKSPEYVVFSARKTREGQQSSNDIYWYDSFTFMLFLSEDGRRLDPVMVDRNSPIIPDTESGGQLLRGRYIFKLSFADMHLSKSDIIFAIRQFNDRVTEALEKKYSKKGLYASKIPRELTASLKEKTLLLPTDLDPDGTDMETISRYYRHPFRLLSQEEIEAARLSGQENTAFLHYIWSDSERMFLGTIIDTHTGELLAVLKPNAVQLEQSNCLPAGTSNRTMIRMKAKRLKSLSRAIK